MLPLLFGIGIVVTYLVLVFLAAWVNRCEGTSWVPVNHSFKYGSDDNVYAALVNSVRQRKGGFEWPATDCPGCREFEILRVGAYRLAWLLGGLVLPPRWLHLVSQIAAVTCHYVLLHLLVWQVTGSSAAALVASLTCLFYFNVLMNQIPVAIKESILRVYNFRRDGYLDLMGDHFRYVMLSVASLFGMSVLLLGQMGASFSGWWMFAYGAALSVLPFSYPGTMLAFGMYAAFSLSLHLLLTRDITAIGMVFLGASPMLAWTLFTGRLTILCRSLRTAPPLLAMIHCAGGETDKIPFRQKIRGQLCFLPVSLAFYSAGVAMLANVAVHMNVALLLVAVAMSVVGSLPGIGRAVARMQNRGAATLYQTVFYVTTAAACVKWLPSLHGWSWVLACVVAAPPLLGSYRMFRVHQANQSFTLETGRMAMYDALRRLATPDSTVACVDVRDLQLALVYGNGRAFVGGGEWLQEPFNAVFRHAGVLAHCGFDSSRLVTWFDEYFSRRGRLKATPLPPHEPDELVEGVVTLNHIVFYPYIPRFDGIVMSDDHQSWTAEAATRFRVAVAEGGRLALTGERPDFIVISKDYEAIRPQPGTPPAGYKVVASSDGHHLYGRV